jgi:N-acyl-D-amino-acid deacylase
VAFDLLIRNGLVVDGSGSPAAAADVGISGGRIEAVERLPQADAGRVVDARGQVVAPGFIDTHAHSDLMLLAEPQHTPKLCQGVTTEIIAQDGLSYAPLSPNNLRDYVRYLSGLYGRPPLDYAWSSVAEFRAQFDRRVAVNTVYLVPHGTVRLEVLGMYDVPLRDDALKKAQALVERGLADGAVGMSTGLSYFPQSYSDTDEIVELCRPVAAADAVYVTHIRTVFRERPFDPVIESLDIGRRSGAKVHFSHFRTSPLTAGQVKERMAPIDGPAGQGVDVSLETYPYPSGSSLGLQLVPAWAHEGGPDAILARLRDPGQRARIADELAAVRDSVQPARWEERIYSHLPSPANQELLGKTMTEAARVRGAASPEELLLDLLLEEDLEVGHVQLPPDDASVWDQVNRDIMQLFERPNYMVGSDSISAGGHPHPRLYGCFPRLIGRFQRQYGGLSLEALVNRATAVAADRFGLTDRGRVQPGKAADLVVFDPNTISDTSTYEAPKSLPVGIDYVVVNGEVAVEGGTPTGVLAGRALP